MRGLFIAISVFFFLGEFSNAQQCASLFSSTQSQLKIGTYNLLNLYLHSGNIRKSTGPHAKPRWAIEQMGELLRGQNYDIFIAQEVESLGSAKKFNEEFLDNQYNIFSTTSKDVRGLLVVFFVKKNLNYHFKLESHAEEKWFDPIKNQESVVFERDLPTLHIYKNKTDEVPLLTMMGAHLKSKRDRFGPKNPLTQEGVVDHESTRLREAQVNRAVSIIQKYQIRFGYNHPILIAGDFNNNHNYASEFVGFFRHAKLTDTLGAKRKIEKYSDRTTHSYFGGEKARHNQLDGILVTSSLLGPLMDSYVVPYKDQHGVKGIPRTKDERKSNPSDHRPITAVFVFDL